MKKLYWHTTRAYVTTGAVLPKGANCVILEENVEKIGADGRDLT